MSATRDKEMKETKESFMSLSNGMVSNEKNIPFDFSNKDSVHPHDIAEIIYYHPFVWGYMPKTNNYVGFHTDNKNIKIKRSDEFPNHIQKVFSPLHTPKKDYIISIEFANKINTWLQEHKNSSNNFCINRSNIITTSASRDNDKSGDTLCAGILDSHPGDIWFHPSCTEIAATMSIGVKRIERLQCLHKQSFIAIDEKGQVHKFNADSEHDYHSDKYVTYDGIIPVGNQINLYLHVVDNYYLTFNNDNILSVWDYNNSDKKYTEITRVAGACSLPIVRDNKIFVNTDLGINVLSAPNFECYSLFPALKNNPILQFTFRILDKPTVLVCLTLQGISELTLSDFKYVATHELKEYLIDDLKNIVVDYCDDITLEKCGAFIKLNKNTDECQSSILRKNHTVLFFDKRSEDHTVNHNKKIQIAEQRNIAEQLANLFNKKISTYGSAKHHRNEIKIIRDLMTNFKEEKESQMPVTETLLGCLIYFSNSAIKQSKEWLGIFKERYSEFSGLLRSVIADFRKNEPGKFLPDEFYKDEDSLIKHYYNHLQTFSANSSSEYKRK